MCCVCASGILSVRAKKLWTINYVYFSFPLPCQLSSILGCAQMRSPSSTPGSRPDFGMAKVAELAGTVFLGGASSLISKLSWYYYDYDSCQPINPIYPFLCQVQLPVPYLMCLTRPRVWFTIGSGRVWSGLVTILFALMHANLAVGFSRRTSEHKSEQFHFFNWLFSLFLITVLLGFQRKTNDEV